MTEKGFIRRWNGQAIKMQGKRICLTDLCKAGETAGGNAIRFSDWFSSEATQRFLLHRAKQLGVNVFAIGAPNATTENSALIVREFETRGDAWGDKVVALKLAARLCTALEHEVYSWYAEEIDKRTSQVRDTQPHALPPAIQNLKAGIELCQLAGVTYDERDLLHIKQVSLYGSVASTTGDVSVSYAVEELGLSAGSLCNQQLKKIGTALSRMFFTQHKKPPQKHDQYCEGAVRKVNTYPKEWMYDNLPILAKERPELFSMQQQDNLPGF